MDVTSGGMQTSDGGLGVRFDIGKAVNDGVDGGIDASKAADAAKGSTGGSARQTIQKARNIVRQANSDYNHVSDVYDHVNNASNDLSGNDDNCGAPPRTQAS